MMSQHSIGTIACGAQSCLVYKLKGQTRCDLLGTLVCPTPQQILSLVQNHSFYRRKVGRGRREFVATPCATYCSGSATAVVLVLSEAVLVLVIDRCAMFRLG
jgi:hypothetical protein